MSTLMTRHTIRLTSDTNLLNLVEEYPLAFERVTQYLYQLREGYEISGYEFLYWDYGIEFNLPRGWIFVQWVRMNTLGDLRQQFMETGVIPTRIRAKFSWPTPGTFTDKRNPFTCYPYLDDAVEILIVDNEPEHDGLTDITKLYKLDLRGYGITNDKETHNTIVYL